MRPLVKVTWLALCLLLLIWYFPNRQVRDADIVTIYASVGLSFPIGCAAAAAAGWGFVLCEQRLGLVATSGTQVVCAWLLIVIAGYFQWFVLLPYAIRRFKPRPDAPDA